MRALLDDTEIDVVTLRSRLELLEVEGRFDEALGLLEELSDDPELSNAHPWRVRLDRARMLWLRGDRTEAKRLANEILAEQPDADFIAFRIYAGLACAQALAGHSADVVRQIEGRLERPDMQRDMVLRSHYLFGVAEIHVINGDPAAAVATLEERFRIVRSVSVRALKLYPAFDSLRGRDDFEALLERWNDE